MTERYRVTGSVVTAYEMPEGVFRGLEPEFGLNPHWLGRYKGGSMVVLSADNLPGFDVDQLTAYLRAREVRHEVETTKEWTP